GQQHDVDFYWPGCFAAEDNFQTTGYKSRKKLFYFWIYQDLLTMKNLIESCFYFIAGHGRGWAFSSSDLLARYSRQQADSLLSELVKQGKIRRVARGIYDYPAYSDLLNRELSPDMDQVANA